MIRLLTESEIECRVSQVKDTSKGIGCSLLLYKDARVDMKILDEEFGAMNWKRSHQMIGDRLYCTISVWDAVKEQWIDKQDVGTETYTEKEKGQASDSFKRAGFNVGIGRELYTAPFIWIPLKDGESYTKNGKLATNARFVVRKIGYTESREICTLVISDSRGNIRFEMHGENESGEDCATLIKAVKKTVFALCGGDKDSAASFYNDNIKADENDSGRLKWHLDALRKQVQRIEAQV